MMGIFDMLFGSSPSSEMSKIDQIELKRFAMILTKINNHDYYDYITNRDMVAIQLACANGSIVACFNLGLIKLYEMHGVREIEHAEQLLLNVANANHPISNKAFLYLFVLEEYKGDRLKGIEYLKKGHNAGDPYASGELGFFYASGEGGIEQDYQVAKKMWTIAAKNGVPGIQENLDRLKSMI